MRPVLSHVRRYALSLVLLVWLPASFAWAEAPGLKPAEYMVYQYPFVSLVIVIDVREAEFEARVEGTEGALIGESGLPGRRIGPLYHFVEAVDKPRQLMIEVTPSRRVDRSQISMQLLQLADSDRNGVRLTRAYRFLAHGMKRVPGGENAVWYDRIYSLRNASQAFAALGMEEMSLWAAHYAAHLSLHGLGDAQRAAEGSRVVMASARRAGFTLLEFVAGVLEAEALMTGLDGEPNPVNEDRVEKARQRWNWVAGRADLLGYRSEHVRALYQEGRALQSLDRVNEAIGRYDAALAASEGVTDVELLNEIRTTAAAAYESSGSTSGAIEILAGLTTDIAAGETSAEQELARNLYEKGRLLNRAWRYVPAMADLQHSIELQGADPERPEWGLAGLELGKAQYATGDPDAAAATTRRALARTPREEKAAMADGWGLLARIARQHGDFDSMAGYRERQDSLLKDDANRAAFLLERGLDAMRQNGPDSSEASGFFREALRSAAGSDVLSGHRAALYACLVNLQARERSGCNPDAVRENHEALRRSGVPEIIVDSGLAWVRILNAAGRDAAARAEAERLLDSVQFYRERLPGMVSAWFAYRREELYALYVELAAVSSPETLLLALLRVRDLERSRPGETGGDDELRSQVSRVVSAQPTPDDALSRQAHRELRVFRENAGWSSGAWSRSALRDVLGRLEGDEMLLAYRFSDENIQAVVARSQGVEVRTIREARNVRGQIESLRQSLAVGFGGSGEPVALLDDLGGRLLGSLGSRLASRIYLLSSGPLNGIPFDALRIDGRFLAERAEVLNLDSLESLREATHRPATGVDTTVFLAGNPRSGRDLFSYGVSTSREIGAVRDRFVGDGLHIVQGVALRNDEFDDERYASASIIHLAMPGRVDLSAPGRSRLLLSGDRETPDAEFLVSERLRGIDVEAQLAVLSGTTFAERPAGDFDSRIGLVSDLYQAGAERIVATLWPAGDEENERFMADFYGALKRGENVQEALRKTRLSRIGGKNGTNLWKWAGFQLFIR